MSELNVRDLLAAMLAAAKDTIGEDVPEAQKYVQSAARSLAANTKEVAGWLATGEVTLDEAKALMRMHERAAKMVLTATETIGLVMAERAINAALDAVRDVVNAAIGFVLL